MYTKALSPPHCFHRLIELLCTKDSSPVQGHTWQGILPQAAGGLKQCWGECRWQVVGQRQQARHGWLPYCPGRQWGHQGVWQYPALMPGWQGYRGGQQVLWWQQRQWWGWQQGQQAQQQQGWFSWEERHPQKCCQPVQWDACHWHWGSLGQLQRALLRTFWNISYGGEVSTSQWRNQPEGPVPLEQRVECGGGTAALDPEAMSAKEGGACMDAETPGSLSRSTSPLSEARGAKRLYNVGINMVLWHMEVRSLSIRDMGKELLGVLMRRAPALYPTGQGSLFSCRLLGTKDPYLMFSPLCHSSVSALVFHASFPCGREWHTMLWVSLPSSCGLFDFPTCRDKQDGGWITSQGDGGSKALYATHSPHTILPCPCPQVAWDKISNMVVWDNMLSSCQAIWLTQCSSHINQHCIHPQ